MKRCYCSVKFLQAALALATLFFSQQGLAGQTVQEKLSVLESNIKVLQQQIVLLKKQMASSSASAENAQRLSALEDYAVELHKVLTDLKDQVEDNSAELTQVAETEKKRTSLKVYGTFVAAKPEGENSILDGQSFELVLSGQPHERLSFFTELEFERAATVGAERGGEVLLEQAYTDVSIKPWLNFRAGVLLLPFGNIERDHYAPLRDVISKPYTSYALAPSDWTDNGLGFNGRFILGDEWFANYQVYAVAGLGNGVTERGLRGTRQGFGVDNNMNKALVGKLEMAPGMITPAALSPDITWILTGKWAGWNGWGNTPTWMWTGNLPVPQEWTAITCVVLSIFQYTNMDVDREFAGSARMDGYYLRGIVNLSRFFHPDWLFSSFPHARMNLVGQYDKVNIENFFDPSAPDNSEERYTLGFQVRPTPSWVANLNYESASGTEVNP